MAEPQRQAWTPETERRREPPERPPAHDETLQEDALRFEWDEPGDELEADTRELNFGDDEADGQAGAEDERRLRQPPLPQWQAIRIGPLELQQPKPDTSPEAGQRPGLAGLFERVFGRVGQELERRGWLERADLPPGWEPTHPCYPDPAVERRNAELLRRQRDLGDLDLGR